MSAETILTNPQEVVGHGSKAFTRRRVSRFWPAGLAMAAVLFAGAAAAHGPADLTTHSTLPTAPLIESVTPLKAQETDATEPAAFQVFYQRLGTFISQPGENKNRFLTRVGNFLATYTKNHGWEACGMIEQAKQGEGWVVNLITNGSQIGCMQIEFDTPGFESTPESIHSHPDKYTLQVSQQDIRFQPGWQCGDRVATSPHDFSERDRHNGAGYLVVPSRMMNKPRLLFQDGGEAQEIAKLSDNHAVAPNQPLTGLALAKKGLVMVPLDKVEGQYVSNSPRRCRTF